MSERRVLRSSLSLSARVYVEHDTGCPLETMDDVTWYAITEQKQAQCTCTEVTVRDVQ